MNEIYTTPSTRIVERNRGEHVKNKNELHSCMEARYCDYVRDEFHNLSSYSTQSLRRLIYLETIGFSNCAESMLLC